MGAPEPVEPTASPLSEHDVYLFREGTHTRLHGKLGCRLHAGGAHFAVWAPNARAVSVIGEFNGWDGGAHPMSPRWDSSGIWECHVGGVLPGAAYKFRVSPQAGGAFDKADPFAFYAQTPPHTASRAWSLDYAWGDGAWMASRAGRNGLAAPMSVYEVHPGSWRRRDGCWLGYRERDKAGLLFNQMVRDGRVSAPIVIGRDHLGSETRPIALRDLRETRDIPREAVVEHRGAQGTRQCGAHSLRRRFG